MAEKIFAIIVTYHPEGDIVSRLSVIASEVDKVIIVDNASNDEARHLLKQAQEALHDKLHIIWNDKNLGLAVALNQGIKQAIEYKADWILTLDDDSVPEKGMVKNMLASYKDYGQKDKIAIIAPDIKDQNSSLATRYLFPNGKLWFSRKILTDNYTDEAITVITSGNLVKTEIFEKIGFLPEHFFIDYLDHTLCLRCKKSGYRILLVKNAVLYHNLGQKTEHKIAGKTINTTHHSAFRRYYIFRNRIWVWRKYACDFPGFVFHDILASCFDIMRVTLYEQDKGKKLIAMIKGIKDGLKREEKTY